MFPLESRKKNLFPLDDAVYDRWNFWRSRTAIRHRDSRAAIHFPCWFVPEFSQAGQCLFYRCPVNYMCHFIAFNPIVDAVQVVPDYDSFN